MGGMLQMMKNMMEGGYDEGEGKTPSSGEKGGGNTGGGGGGKEGDNNSGETGALDQTSKNHQRTVPKNSGISGTSIPREVQKALDAYNKAAIKKSNTP